VSSSVVGMDDSSRDASKGTRTRVPGTGLPDTADAGLPGAGPADAGLPGSGLLGVHPVLGCIGVIDDALSAVNGVDPMFLSTTDKRTALLEIHRVRTRLAALEYRVIACAGDVAAVDGDPNVAAWLGPRTLDDPRTNHRTEKLARRLAARWNLTETALAAGAVNTAQAQVIVEALDVLEGTDLGLPVETKAGLLGQAEQALLGYAAEFAPKQLRILGRRILQVLAPDLFDDAERKRLEEEERRAHARTRLSLHRNGDGTTTLRATLPDAVALRLKNLLEAYTSPRHPGTRPRKPDTSQTGEHGTGQHGTGECCGQHGTGNGTDGNGTDGNGAADTGAGENGSGSGDSGTDQDRSAGDMNGQRGCATNGGAENEPESDLGAGVGVPLVDPATGEKVPHDQRLGLALQAFLEALDPAKLPIKAGAGTSLIVTMDYRKLRDGVGVATLPDGSPLSAGETRRLGCSCGILPAVLGGDSAVLDLGTSRRFFDRYQVIAKRITTHTCQAYGCTVPADWCEAHHGRTPWAEGGTTDLADLDFLCPFHHHRAHDPAYRVDKMPNGDYRFHRRT